MWNSRVVTIHPFLYSVFPQDTGEPGWWRGETGGREGVFPDNFVVIHSEAEKEVSEQNE